MTPAALTGLVMPLDPVPDLLEPFAPERSDLLPPAWRKGLDRLGPWDNGTLPGLGRVARADWSGQPVIICGPCSSCLDVAWRFDSILPVWSSVLAVSQWAGRGQLRRSWQSPVGNIYAAFKWPEELSGPVSLTAGLLCALALEKTLGLEPGALQIKWPNDLLYFDRKVGGILVEERGQTLWVGLGLNTAFAPADELMAREGAFPAGCLEAAVRLDLPGLWLGLVQEMKSVYSHMRGTRSGFQDLADSDLEGRLAFVGREVDFQDDVLVRGRLLGLDRDGGLRLRLADGREKVFLSGSIRGLA